MSLKKILQLAVAAGCLGSGLSHANLVTNGGFEAGNFTGWTQSGNNGFSGVDSFAPHSGTFGAFFGPSSPGGIAQNIATVAGATYTIDFWLKNEADVLGTAVPNSFVFNWNGGAAEQSLSNASPFDYQHFTFSLQATSDLTSISFSFTQLPAFWDLDDVSVVAATAVPEPGSLALLGLGLAGLAVLRKRKQA